MTAPEKGWWYWTKNLLGIDLQKHKEHLYHFYEGSFPGSWAKGELYNYDPATGGAIVQLRSCQFIPHIKYTSTT